MTVWWRMESSGDWSNISLSLFLIHQRKGRLHRKKKKEGKKKKNILVSVFAAAVFVFARFTLRPNTNPKLGSGYISQLVKITRHTRVLQYIRWETTKNYAHFWDIIIGRTGRLSREHEDPKYGPSVPPKRACQFCNKLSLSVTSSSNVLFGHWYTILKLFLWPKIMMFAISFYSLREAEN